MKKLEYWMFGIIALVFSLACGSSGGGIAGVSIEGTGTGSGTSIQASGEITQIGSIFVGGYKFKTDSALVKFDESDDLHTNLSLGMVVSVSGNLIEGSDNIYLANEVFFNSHIAGKVESYTASSNILTLKETQVFISANTHFGEGVSYDQLVKDAYVKISGTYRDDLSQLDASFIGKAKDGDDFKRDRGHHHPAFVSGRSYILHGKVRNKKSSTEFEIDNKSVVVTNSTVVLGKTGEVMNGYEVHAKGVATSSESMELASLFIEGEDDDEMEDKEVTIDKINERNSTIEANGKVYYLTKHTKYESKKRNSRTAFGFKDLTVGDVVELDYFTDFLSRNIVKKLEQE